MKATTKPEEVDYIQFNGVNMGEILIMAGCNIPLNIQEPLTKPVHLDLFSGKKTICIGDYAVIHAGALKSLTESEFHHAYDIEPKESHRVNTGVFGCDGIELKLGDIVMVKGKNEVPKKVTFHYGSFCLQAERSNPTPLFNYVSHDRKFKVTPPVTESE